MDVHVYHHIQFDSRLDEILALLKKGMEKMATDLASLENQVAQNTSAEQSAVQLLTQLHAMLVEAQTDPAKLDALIAQLNQSKENLAAAIVANTI
jgi:chromosome segregation ATPase